MIRHAPAHRDLMDLGPGTLEEIDISDPGPPREAHWLRARGGLRDGRPIARISRLRRCAAGQSGSMPDSPRHVRDEADLSVRRRLTPPAAGCPLHLRQAARSSSRLPGNGRQHLGAERTGVGDRDCRGRHRHRVAGRESRVTRAPARAALPRAPLNHTGIHSPSSRRRPIADTTMRIPTLPS